ncbi:MAG: hypothetical protein QNJ53_22705 [Pleurocapsa sp. MO_192.B19]|nr:hypothetical protein [Pleurocapsa sp. MO_192.B19]
MSQLEQNVRVHRLNPQAMKTVLPVNQSNGIERKAIVDKFSYEDAERELGIRTTALKMLIRAANIYPHVEENHKTPYLDFEQMEELRRIHDHLSTGKSAESYQGKYTSDCNTSPSKIYETLVNSSQLDYVSPGGIEKYGTELRPILEWDALHRNAIDEISMNTRLRAYAKFNIFAASNQSISDGEIQEAIGWKPTRTGFTEDCYRFIRHGKINVLNKKTKKLEKQSTWLIEKFDPIQEAEAKKITKIADEIHEAKAIAVYEAMKDMMNE